MEIVGCVDPFDKYIIQITMNQRQNKNFYDKIINTPIITII